jgi:hypothetical protein
MATRLSSVETGSPPTRGRIKLHLQLLSERGSRVVSGLFLAVAVGMLPWVAFLGVTLPPRYDADHWNLLWVGFDVALLCVLGYAAWAAWFRRQILASTSLIAGTLLLCDAWFDVITSIGHRDQWLTVLTAVGGELPLAIFFFWLYRRIVLTTLATFHELLGDGPSPRRLHEAQIFSFPTRAPLVSTNPCDANLGLDAFSAGQPTASGENGSSGSGEWVSSRAVKEKESNATDALGPSALVSGSIRIHHREMECSAPACPVRPVSGPPRVGTES